MEPVRGGMLGDMLPPAVKAVFDAAGQQQSYASWALRFAASLEGVETVLSGMSTLEQLRENIELFKDFRPLDDAELAVIEKARAALERLPSIPCTSCDYCVADCPKGIVIPKLFETFNRDLMYNDFNAAKFGYAWECQFSAKASDCCQCGKCEEVCPQQIEIMAALKQGAEKYED